MSDDVDEEFEKGFNDEHNDDSKRESRMINKYLNNWESYLEHVFAVWREYFASKQELRDFYAAISDEQDQALFLRVGSFYRFLVREGHFHFEDEDLNMSYIDDSYKYIAILSLVEALGGSSGGYVSFHDWLHRKMKSTCLTLAESIMDSIDRSYIEYNAEHGANQAAFRFFDCLDPQDQQLIQARLEIHNKDNSIKKLVQFLYNIRSKFVHEAQLVLGFGDKTTFECDKGKVIAVNKLSMRDMQTLFEHGFLKRFGYKNTLNS
jgi:hypothetical protein